MMVTHYLYSKSETVIKMCSEVIRHTFSIMSSDIIYL